jgi:hypothetical protein
MGKKTPRNEPGIPTERRNVERWQRQEALRKAEVAYITDPKQRSINHWWRMLCSGIIHPGTFKNIAVRGRWADRRDRWWQEATQKVLNKTQLRVVRDRVRELGELQSVRNELFELIQPKIVDGRKIFAVQPSTLEGLVRAFAKIDELGDAKRDSVMASIEPDLIREEFGEDKLPFKHEEIENVVKVLLNGRFTEQRKRLEAHQESDNGTEDESD